jgi:hypothetical protein
MLDLNMAFQHVVNCAGMAIFELFVGLICVCVLTLLIIGGIAAATWVEQDRSDDTMDAHAEANAAATPVFMTPVF